MEKFRAHPTPCVADQATVCREEPSAPQEQEPWNEDSAEDDEDEARRGRYISGRGRQRRRLADRRKWHFDGMKVRGGPVVDEAFMDMYASEGTGKRKSRV